jgi:hypothetical protein
VTNLYLIVIKSDDEIENEKMLTLKGYRGILRKLARRKSKRYENIFEISLDICEILEDNFPLIPLIVVPLQLIRRRYNMGMEAYQSYCIQALQNKAKTLGLDTIEVKKHPNLLRYYLENDPRYASLENKSLENGKC